jgi:tetratricopeptide (TPR) repeat protein
MEWLYSRGVPIEAQYLYRKAFELAGNGNDTDAIRYYRQALVIAPAYTKARYEMGNSYARLGMIPEALSLYNQAIRNDPAGGEVQKLRDCIRSCREI